MTPKLEEILKRSLDLALSVGYTMNQFFCLVEKKSCYMPASEMNPCCHPLETMVLGQKIDDCINHEIAANLGVTINWIDGFLDGYGGNTPDSLYLKLHRGDPIRKKYLEGWSDGKEVTEWVTDLEG